MNRKAIIAIIILMSTSLLGIAIIQWTWIKRAVDLNEKAFTDKATTALSRVKDRIVEDYDRFKKTENIKLGISYSQPSTLSPYLRQRRSQEIAENLLLFNDESYFDVKQKENLDKYIKEEISAQGIDQYFDYGVYSKKWKGFNILNGNYTVTFDSLRASEAETSIEENLYNSEFEIPLFNDIDQSLKVYFPNKNKWASVIPQMLTSILFTSLVLFCFIYTLYIIFKQKKISEITNDFINNMTHEFKTPIATISLATDSINNPTIIKDENKIKRFLTIIKQENKRMLSQVEKVLQMALLEKDDFKLKFTGVYANDLINQVVQNAELQVTNRGGNIKIDLEANPDLIEADITHFSNIIHNLLDNANKYSPETPEITVNTHNVNNGIAISVRDKGLGMTKEAIKHIFDKFYRVHTGNRHDVKGFGLGLSYVKAMVNAHNGTIVVESEPGKGSNFIINFPYRQ